MSVDLRTELNDADNATGWASDDAVALDTTTGQRYEGSGSISSQFTNSNTHTWAAQTSGGGGAFNRDLSASTVFVLVKDNLLSTYSSSGAQITLGDGTDDIGYRVGGNDAPGLSLRPYFSCFKLDVSVIVATPGTFVTYAGTEANLDQTQITRVGFGALHLAKAVGAIDNVWFDRIMHHANNAYALRINGGTSGTPITMATTQAADVSNGWGLINNPLGSMFQFFGSTEWGNPTATADHYFTATDEQWFLIGDNAGGHAIGAGNFIFRVVGNATDFGSFKLTRVTIVSTGTPAVFDLSSSNMDETQLDGVVFTNLGTITMPVQDAGSKFANDCVFNNCAQADLQSLDMDSCTFNGTTDADGAIKWDENTTDPANQDNFTFNSDGTGHAIEVAPSGAGPFTYNITGYTFDGYAGQSGTSTDRVFFINPSTLSANITINLTDSTALNVVGGGSGFSWREVASYTGTVTIQQTVNLSVQVNDSDGNGVAGARVRIELVSDGSLVSQGTANGSGLYTDSYVFGGDVAVRVKARLKGYKPNRGTTTITASGMTFSIGLNTDNIVDLP